MSPRVNAANRAILTLLGLTLLAAGIVGLAVSLGWFGAPRSAGPVLPEQMRTLAADQPWFWWAVAVACLVLALLGLRWLLAQLRTDRIARLDLTSDERDGLTSVHSGAVTDAIQTEVQTIRGVSRASAHLRGQAGHRLSLRVNLTDNADIAEVRRRLEEQTVPHLRQAIDDPTLPIDVELRPSTTRSPRALT